MNVTFQLTGLPELQRRMGALGRQVPFAASKALNATANDVQAAQREQVARDFILRRKDFILRTVYRKPGEDFATRAKLAAAVRIDERRNLLGKFQEPGTKRPQDGRSLALPQEVKRNKADIVTKGNRPRAFNLREVGEATKGERRTFLIRRNGASWLLLQRTGRGRSRTRNRAAQIVGRDPKLRVLYVFKRETRIPKRLAFYETARKAFESKASDNMRVALNDAIRTAR